MGILGQGGNTFANCFCMIDAAGKDIVHPQAIFVHSNGHPCILSANERNASLSARLKLRNVHSGIYREGGAGNLLCQDLGGIPQGIAPCRQFPCIKLQLAVSYGKEVLPPVAHKLPLQAQLFAGKVIGCLFRGHWLLRCRRFLVAHYRHTACRACSSNGCFACIFPCLYRGRIHRMLVLHAQGRPTVFFPMHGLQMGNTAI